MHCKADSIFFAKYSTDMRAILYTDFILHFILQNKILGIFQNIISRTHRNVALSIGNLQDFHFALTFLESSVAL